MIGKYADNLKSLRALRFDWARNDGNQDHVYSNEAFTHKLNEFGIPHEAEEYNGVWGTGNWGVDGRVIQRCCHSSRDILSLQPERSDSSGRL